VTAPAANKRPCGEAQVVEEIAQPSSQPNIANFLLNLRDAPELDRGLPSRLRCRQPCPYQIIHAAVDVIVQFTVEIALQSSPPEPVQQLHHQLPSLKINWTAPVSLAQLSFSAASCFRPEGVKE
jgi:hypothetical protein